MDSLANANSPIKQLQKIHAALLLGQVVFCMLSIFLVYTKTWQAPLAELNNVLQVVCILFAAITCYIGIEVVFKKRIFAVRNSKSISATEKFTIYKKASLIQWACIEAAMLLSTICFLLVGNYAFIALSITLILLFAIMGASKQKLMLLLNIANQEIQAL
jgi:hypothetical protein